MRFYLGYGIGDFGLNIYWNTLSLILVFWYAEVVGLPPETAGLIYFIGMSWDAVSDLVIANLTQRTKTLFGTYRPYLAGGGVFLGLAFILLFWVPPLEAQYLIGYLIVTHIMFRLAYTVVAVPYSAMASRISYDSKERTTLSGTRMAFAFSGLLVVSMFWFPTVRWFSNGDELGAEGFLVTATIGAIIATISLLLCFASTPERSLNKQADFETDISITGFLNAIGTNSALKVLLIAIFLQSFAISSFLISLAFYIEAHSSHFASKEQVMTGYAVSTLIAVPGWTWVIRHVGKRSAWHILVACAISTRVSLAIFGPILIIGIPLQVLFFGLSIGGFSVLIWSLVPDTVEYGQWQSGTRNEGAVFGSVLLFQKLAGGAAGLLVGRILSLVSYDADLVSQTPHTANSLELFIALAPTLIFAVSSIVILRLPLNRGMHSKIVEVIQSPENRE